jgi:2-polyprenyl-6-methoxyphenol hydroxylase-like FAD-dependent oxidoreductase
VTKTATALVIGGGIAGPVAAMALRKAGIEAVVYERFDQPADGIGGMIGLAPNGANALGSIGLKDAVLKIGDPVQSMIMRSWTGKRLAEFGSAGGPPVLHTIWRSELYRVLEQEATSRGVKIEYGKRLTGVEDTGDGVIAHFADGTSATGDILIGADGIRSTVRTLIDPQAPQPRYTGLISFGGRPVVPLSVPSTHGSLNMFYGKKAVFAYGVDDGGNAGWFVNLPSKEPMSLQDARAVGASEWLRRLTEVFGEDRSPAVEILTASDPDELIIVGGVYDLPEIPTWSKGRIVLIGDAAHATSPSSGQGASIAIESAIQLARCLRDAPTLHEALSAYEILRRPRVRRIIAAGHKTDSTKTPGPLARALRDMFLPMVMKLLVKPEKMAWQVDYRIDFEAPVEIPTMSDS